MIEANDIDKYMIEKKGVSNSPLDYENLRSLGIKLTQDFSAETWTDYNLHDPGVTILETLCYAITDLAYRTKFRIEDILTDEDGTIDSKKNYFISPRDILSTNPVSVNDFRKLLIDNFPEIENAWLEPYTPRIPVTGCKGQLSVLIQFKHMLMQDCKPWDERTKQIRKEQISQFINGHRNLGEIFQEVIFLEPRKVEVRADVLIKDNQLPEDLLVNIYAEIYRTLSPLIKFYSALEMKQMGFSSAEIYHGPYMHNGFLEEASLNSRQRMVDPTDLAKAVAAVPGVLRVKDFSIFVDGVEYERNVFIPGEEKKEEFLFFDYKSPGQNINLYQDGFKIPINKDNLFHKLKIRLDLAVNNTQGQERNGSVVAVNENKQPKGLGAYRKLDYYQSFQYLFPEIYKLKTGIDKLERNKKGYSDAEIAAVKQLKAYLMFFEQVMANYLAQLSNISNVFSSNIPEEKLQTYFFQPVYDVPDADKILNDFNSETTSWEKFKADPNNAYMKFLQRKIESDTVFLNRKGRVLDHALSRFNITLDIYPLKLYRELYDKNKVEGRRTKLLLWKKGLLDNITLLLRNRGQAYNNNQPLEEKKMGGFQYLMRQLLYIGIDSDAGVKNYELRTLCPEFKTGGERGFNMVNDTGATQPRLNGPLIFKKMNTTFFCDALNPDNYQIARVDDNEVQLLYFANTDEDQQHEVGIFSDYFTAIDARNKFIEYLRKINIESEGFHLVEHNLLLPPYHEPISSFGFKITDSSNYTICRHYECTLYSQREQLIKNLLDEAKKSSNEFVSFLEKEGGHICKFPVENNENPAHYFNISMLQHLYKNDRAKLDEIFEGLRKRLLEIGAGKNGAGAKIISLIKYADDAVVEEDFFNFRLTVVLPSWPARFQDDKFRSFVERTFIENTPAHLRLDFIWLDMAKMKTFETIYFNWLTELNKNKLSLYTIEGANSLIAWLKKIKTV